MQRIRRSELEAIAQVEQPWCVSMLMPMQRAGRDVEQNRIRLKNLIKKATRQLVEAGHNQEQADQRLEHATRLMEDLSFWGAPADGVAMFLADGQSYELHAPAALPETAFVSNRFYVAPLLPLVFEDARFFLLAISPKRVRFFEGDRDEIRQVEVPDMPTSLEELTRYIESERQLQFHTKAPPADKPGARAGVFHGQGGGGANEGEHQQRILEFCRWVDQALQRVLAPQRTPLLLACDKSVEPLFRRATAYKHVLEAIVAGNPDDKSPEILHDQAWKVMKLHVEQTRGRAAEVVQEAVGRQRGSQIPEEVVLAAMDGRVDLLAMSEGARKWGCVDRQERRVLAEDADAGEPEELVNLAASKTFVTGGRVFAFPPDDMPADGPIAAAYRY